MGKVVHFFGKFLNSNTEEFVQGKVEGGSFFKVFVENFLECRVFGKLLTVGTG